MKRFLPENVVPNSSRPPPTKVFLHPGESPWLALAQEIAARPDGPVALGVMSSLNKMVRPRDLAIERLIEALAKDLESPGDDAVEAEIMSARAQWENLCQTTMSESLMAQFRKDAQTLIDQRKTRPPEMATILADGGDRRDFGYELGGDLSGLQGTWHRLWSSISMARLFGQPDGAALVLELRSEFEGILGRSISPEEWEQLVAHAHNHCDTVMRPRFGDLASGTDQPV